MTRTLPNLVRQHRLELNTIMLVTLTSMVFIYPFDNHFRFTLGIAVLSTLLLYFPELPAVRFTIACGVCIVALRTAIYFFIGPEELDDTLFRHSPAFLYYVIFGILFKLLSIRTFIDNLPVAVLLLTLTDALSNLAELLLRPTLQPVSFDLILASIVSAGLVRSIITVYGYVLLKQYHAFVLEQNQLKHYAELTMMTAKLKTELFYLQKSSQDIENVMERSYWLYNQLNHNEDEAGNRESNSASALEIAREIHEVKKDYARVITGIENILKPSSLEQFMNLSEVLYIIEQNVRRYLASSNKAISITFDHTEDFKTGRHYTIVSLLDNLIMNAIDACGKSGHIRVLQTTSGTDIVFEVRDNGCGIHSQEIALVFQPGFSTKFSLQTGKISTGLGLSHVKNLTESLKGTVSVSSSIGKGARFMITIPREELIIREG
ncbi:two-component system sensor histidine kinase YcbA [Anaerospora hongkongensis]|uniref:histidine kinase n=1 Tax=Anaerospora hongkongensis TaxID=244830 RepID=A0A4R1PQ43_9FIRM|nr:sensor histidine kinase [Anaerospora hongkongensis]TCL33610.1 two-component system sensor histidine kinase YcbA [Anaerospora hongkongensis]